MNKVKGYRNMLNETQQEWADMLSISRVSYISKENKKTPFTDKEKVIIYGDFRWLDTNSKNGIFMAPEPFMTSGLTCTACFPRRPCGKWKKLLQPIPDAAFW